MSEETKIMGSERRANVSRSPPMIKEFLVRALLHDHPFPIEVMSRNWIDRLT